MTIVNQLLVHEDRTDNPEASCETPGCSMRIAVSWNAAVNFIVPMGYEDGSGFHYGTPPVPHGSGGVTFDF